MNMMKWHVHNMKWKEYRKLGMLNETLGSILRFQCCQWMTCPWSPVNDISTFSPAYHNCQFAIPASSVLLKNRKWYQQNTAASPSHRSSSRLWFQLSFDSHILLDFTLTLVCQAGSGSHDGYIAMATNQLQNIPKSLLSRGKSVQPSPSRCLSSPLSPPQNGWL